MRHATALAVLLLTLVALPALADSITPPVTSISFSGATTNTIFNYPNFYLHSSNEGPNFCPTNCVNMDVQLMPDGSFGKLSTAYVWDTAAITFGSLGKVSLNQQTDMLSGIFWGKEDSATATSGPSWYMVKGTFSENLRTGSGSLDLTSEKFIGTTAVPEPETLSMLGTGLCAIAGVVMRKLRRLPRGCD